MIIQNKEKNIDILERLKDIIVSTKLTETNLTNHKNIIHSLINLINQKREDIYMMNSKVEIMEKELKFWIYDFDKIKTNKKLRDEMAKIQVETILNNLNDELKHKRYYFM